MSETRIERKSQVVELRIFGGLGVGETADDARLGRRAAIKPLPPEFTSQPECALRFEQEARAQLAGGVDAMSGDHT